MMYADRVSARFQKKCITLADFSANRRNNEDENRNFTDIQSSSQTGDKFVWNIWEKLTTGHVKVHPPRYRTN